MILSRLPLFAVVVYSITLAVGCTQRATTLSPDSEKTSAPSTYSEEHSSHVNLEALENDSTGLNASTLESRNLRLSQLWYERSEALSSIPGPGAMAALLRSSHFAIESLLSEPCANPFNETCRDLHRAYLRALEKIVREASRNEWDLPDLAPSRYRFSGADTEKLKSLRDWRFLDASSVGRRDGDRAGLGLPFVACREKWRDEANGGLTGLSICSPITFVLTFERSTQEERLTAHLAAVNSYEREVFETRGIAVPIASATSAALETILRGADNANGSDRLWCLTRPDRTTTMALGIISAPSSAINLLEPFGAIAHDPELQASYTPCAFVVGGGGSLKNATTLLRLSRALVAPRDNAALERTPIRVLPLVSGNRAAAMTRALLARIKRQAHRAAKAPSQPTTFSVPAVSINVASVDTATIDEIERYAKDLNAPQIRAPDQASMLREIPSIARTYRRRDKGEEALERSTDESRSNPNELPLSPVM